MEASQRFRYALPNSSVAGAAVDIGQLGIRIDLMLSGALDVEGNGSTVDSLRACALAAMRGATSGIMVRGLGSATPAITCTAGHVFTQLRHEFPAPATVCFTGRCEIDFDWRSDAAEVTVRGTPGYALEVTTLPTPANGRNVFFEHDGELASIGMVVLKAVPIAPGALNLRT